MTKRNKLLIIGGGNMGYAIANGISNCTGLNNWETAFVEQKKERANFLISKGYKTFSGVEKALKNNKAQIYSILLAVKPNDLTEVLKEIRNLTAKNTLIISIAAGIKIKKISSYLNSEQPVVRVMPNTPCQTNKGMSVITFNKNVNKAQKTAVMKIFKSVGEAIILSEHNFDLATAISGSGPAYFCYLIECLTASAVSGGLKKDIAETLVLQTAYGTTSLLKAKDISPEALRKSVTSPKGTTEAALNILLKNNFSNLISKAIKAAKDRAAELSNS